MSYEIFLSVLNTQGKNKIHMGNGTDHAISQIGQSSFISSSFPSNSRALHLQNLLHVPLITKNLISVSQCCIDNNAFFEFHANYCCVKDKTTKQVLIESVVDRGLYNFS